MKEDPKGRHYKKENQKETDATVVVALIVMLRNVVFLLGQRSAIAVRASSTWWRPALTELGAAARPFSGKTGSRASATHFDVPSRGGGGGYSYPSPPFPQEARSEVSEWPGTSPAEASSTKSSAAPEDQSKKGPSVQKRKKT